MSRLDIVKSSTEPNRENLWLDRDKLKFYGPKGWTTLTGGEVVQDPAPVQPSSGIKKKVIELSEDAFINLITDGKIVISDVDMSEPYDSVVLKIGDIEYACYKSIIVDNTVKYTFIDVNTTTRSGSDIETETFLNKELTAIVLTYPIGGGSLSAMTELIDTNIVIPAATQTVIGGIKQVQDIADLVVDSANAEIIAGKINDLLAALRSAGILTQ